MSKKDFIALADVLRPFVDRTVDSQAIIDAVADFCASQNPRFMRGRWLAYMRGECGPNGGEIKRNAA